jgi:hypothetical protein
MKKTTGSPEGAVAPILEKADASNPAVQVPEVPTFYYTYIKFVC